MSKPEDAAPDVTPISPGGVQEGRNVRAYERVYAQCLQAAERIGPTLDIDKRLGIADTLFDRYYDDQVKLGIEAKKMQTVEPLIELFQKFVERQGG